jgi:UrcA family protein
MKLVLIGTALAAALLAAPVAATPGEKRRDVRVKVADLDLGTPGGIVALDRRLARAVVKACGTAHYLEPEKLNEMDRCRAAARDRALAARKAILDRHLGGAVTVVAGTFK